ncbi:nuclear transport factor 2 family protein [Microbacterium sp.]|uniref:nuclear transport factor 2 family protein n=1 Tax=Microbacterium sp. TaxID=51671 RepID=UPI002812582B|nr:nuclear transport factor 2 family protein [Microbacterium sp.]
MNEIVTAYLETWNATETGVRAALLERHWADDAAYTDPMVAVSGRAGIGGVIEAVQGQFPGFVFSLVGTPDTHHGYTRFQWGLGPAGDEPLVVGFDVLNTDDTGRIRQVIGFLDRVPA